MKKKIDNTISFVVPVYNDSNSIEKMVRSVKDQDLPGIEIIAVNDGSTDDSKKVLDSLKEQGLIDNLIHLEKNSGACVARNLGAKEAKGKYLSFLPADAILYPGMARIWYNYLEENPDYDFLYGGYRFIDEEGEPTPNGDLFFQTFEPYALETTNYIDGSFPIRTEAFWKYAKIMNQPDGLWDPNIKSLQDWDFWLSVVKNGGKGLYVQDIFFGTTMPHPGGLSFDSSNNWIERTEAIKKKHGIPDRRICVASLGAAFHAKRIAHLLDADFKEMPSFKPHHYDAIYAVGFYPEFAVQQDLMFYNNCYDPKQGRSSAKKIVHFVGSDIWQLYNVSLRNLKIWQSYMKNSVDEVLCEADFTQAELKELGIEAKVVPIPPHTLFPLMELPKEFTVACYMPLVNAEFYRPADMVEIAKKMSDVKFKFFGNPQKIGVDPEIKNIEYCGYITNMEDFLKECSAIMRFPVHDGLPLSVLEFLLAGRYSIQSVPVPFTAHLQEFGVDGAVEGLRHLQKMAEDGPYKDASDYFRKELDHELYKKRILELAEYDPKEYWEKRAKSWALNEVQARGAPNPIEAKKEEIKEMFLKLNPKSVLEIGCGDARWYSDLKEWGVEEYEGVDISENLIMAAQLRFPHLKDKLHISDVKDFKTDKKFDVVFSHCCLLHVPEKDFQASVEAIKKLGKKLIMAEPHGFRSQAYCIDHPYKDAFNVIEENVISQPPYSTNKVLYLCNLE